MNFDTFRRIVDVSCEKAGLSPTEDERNAAVAGACVAALFANERPHEAALGVLERAVEDWKARA